LPQGRPGLCQTAARSHGAVWVAARFTNTSETGWHGFCLVWVN